MITGNPMRFASGEGMIRDRVSTSLPGEQRKAVFAGRFLAR